MSCVFVIFSLLVNFIYADWIKLPPISPTATTNLLSHHELPKVVFKLAVPPEESPSEIMSNVFAYKQPTTEATFIMENISTRKSYIKRFFHTTVTSKIVDIGVNNNNTDIMTYHNSMEPVILHRPNKIKKNNNRVTYFNKTVAMNVVPLKINQIITKDDGDETFEDEIDDDGVSINNDDEDEKVNFDIDEYYYDEYDDEVPKFQFQSPTRTSSTTTTTSTTEIPKTHKASLHKNQAQKPQRRMMIKVLNNKSSKKPFNVNFPSFLNFFKQIQESFATRTAKTIGEKIKMLMSFRDRLMIAINKQIKRLWRVQPKIKTKKRSKRTLGQSNSGWMDGGSSGAMDFPSAEGALLSICFLTFAVFLIKLVLQVIQTIKMKKAMWATQMMMGTDNVVIKRQKRSEQEYYDNLIKVLDSVENLKIK